MEFLALMQPTAPALPLMGLWQIPLLGQIAAEPVPDWLLSRLLSSELQINSFGGLTMGSQVALPGDLVVRSPNDERISFRRPENDPARMAIAA